MLAFGRLTRNTAQSMHRCFYIYISLDFCLRWCVYTCVHGHEPIAESWQRWVSFAISHLLVGKNLRRLVLFCFSTKGKPKVFLKSGKLFTYSERIKKINYWHCHCGDCWGCGRNHGGLGVRVSFYFFPTTSSNNAKLYDDFVIYWCNFIMTWPLLYFAFFFYWLLIVALL